MGCGGTGGRRGAEAGPGREGRRERGEGAVGVEGAARFRGWGRCAGRKVWMPARARWTKETCRSGREREGAAVSETKPRGAGGHLALGMDAAEDKAQTHAGMRSLPGSTLPCAPGYFVAEGGDPSTTDGAGRSRPVPSSCPHVPSSSCPTSASAGAPCPAAAPAGCPCRCPPPPGESSAAGAAQEERAAGAGAVQACRGRSGPPHAAIRPYAAGSAAPPAAHRPPIGAGQPRQAWRRGNVKREYQ